MRKKTEDRIRRVVRDELKDGLKLAHDALAYLVSAAIENCQCDACKAVKAKAADEKKAPASIEYREEPKTGQYL